MRPMSETALTNRYKISLLQLIDIGVKDAIYESDTRALVRVLVGKFDVYFPETTRKGR